MAKLLLIEDDLIFAHVVKSSLESESHHVDHTADGDYGLKLLKVEQYDAAIIDWQLPGKCGPDICSEFRRGGGLTPVLMITGKKKTADLVEGLDSGADDFISKPLQLAELHARLRCLLRRPQTYESPVLKVGAIELHLNTGAVAVDGEKITLTRKELAILELLMKHPGQVFSGSAIMVRVCIDGDSIKRSKRYRHQKRDQSKTATPKVPAGTNRKQKSHRLPVFDRDK